VLTATVPSVKDKAGMSDGSKPTRLTRRQRELAERPNCAVCGIRVVRKTSDLIDGKLWCLSCCRGPRKNRRKLTEQRRQLFAQYPYCTYCRCQLQWKESTIDHVVPLSKGGTNDLENLALACHPCNSLKGNKLLGEGVDQRIRASDEWALALFAMQMRVQNAVAFDAQIPPNSMVSGLDAFYDVGIEITPNSVV